MRWVIRDEKVLDRIWMRGQPLGVSGLTAGWVNNYVAVTAQGYGTLLTMSNTPGCFSYPNVYFLGGGF